MSNDLVEKTVEKIISIGVSILITCTALWAVTVTIYGLAQVILWAIQ